MSTQLRIRLYSAAILLTVIALSGHLNPAAAQCPLTVHTTYAPVQQLAIGDVDLEHFNSHRLLFTIQIGNPSGTDIRATLSINVTIRLASDPNHGDNQILFQSDTITIHAGGRQITNLDLGQGGISLKAVNGVSTYIKDNVENVALTTGKFPAGSYIFEPSLTCDGGTVTGPPVIYDIQNPSRVELRSPSDGETTNEFPFFEFYSDGVRNILTVAEKRPDQSREDAILRRPPMLEVELDHQYAYFYSGGRPLEDGKSYVWRVVNRTTGAGGADIDVTSPVGLFTVSASGQGGRFNDALLNQLEEMFGSRYPALFRQIRNGNMTFTGHFSRDGSPLDENSLLNLLNELRSDPDAVELSLE